MKAAESWFAPRPPLRLLLARALEGSRGLSGERSVLLEMSRCYLCPTSGEGVPGTRGRLSPIPSQVPNHKSDVLGESDLSPPTLCRAVSQGHFQGSTVLCSLGLSALPKASLGTQCGGCRRSISHSKHVGKGV